MPVIPDRAKAAILMGELAERPDRALLVSRIDGDSQAYVTVSDDGYVVTMVRDGAVVASVTAGEPTVRRLILTWQPRGIRRRAATPVADT